PTIDLAADFANGQLAGGIALQRTVDEELRLRPDAFAAQNGRRADDGAFHDDGRLADELIVGGKHDRGRRGGGSEKQKGTRRPVHPEVLQHCGRSPSGGGLLPAYAGLEPGGERVESLERSYSALTPERAATIP